MEIRSLTPQEVKLGRPQGSLGKIRAVHHLVARLFAKGRKVAEIAKIVNRTPATVRNWINSPANAELVAQYEKEECEVVENEIDYRIELGRRAGTLAIERLVEKLEAGEIDDGKLLLAISADVNDRTGIAKTTNQVNLNIDLRARLEKAQAARLKVIDGRTGTITKFVRRF